MTWVRLDSEVYAHPKILATPPRACWAWVAGLAYANRYLTDGAVPAQALASIRATPADVRALVDIGLWLPGPDGWRIHDFDQYQPTRERVEADRASARERMARLRRNGRRDA